MNNIDINSEEIQNKIKKLEFVEIGKCKNLTLKDLLYED